jgi:serine/threonine-protein kinase
MDLFALGVMSWELLCNRRLFARAADKEVLDAVSTLTPPRVTTLRPEVPPAIDALVAALLEREPQRRVQAARRVSAVLHGLRGPGAPFPGGRESLVAALSESALTPHAALGGQPDALTVLE